MTLEIQKKRAIFKFKQIWFADCPYDEKGFSRLIFRDCKNGTDVAGFSCKKFTTLVIDLTQDLDIIWKNMSGGNARKAINRAERAGVKVELNQKYKEFYNLYKSVILTKKLPSSLVKIEDIKKYGTLLVAELNGQIISGHGYLQDQNTMRSWVIGSKRFISRKEVTMVANAGKLIIWEAIKYAKTKGVKEFDFGGYYTGEKKDYQKEKINIFKKSFGGKIVVRYECKKDYSKIYNFITRIHHLFK